MISIVIPAYNESANIPSTIQEICAALNKSADSYEIIVVDDHSSDGTFEATKNLIMDNVRAIRLSRRCGSHTAIRAGMHSSVGDAVICISADGQDDPFVIPQMLEKWHQGAQIVWALRYSRRNEPWLIKLPSMIFYTILDWMTLPSQAHSTIDLSRADFYLLDRRVVSAINSCQERHTSLFGLVVWSGFNQNYVEYERKPRKKGTSKWNFRSRLNLAKDWVIAFSDLPLKVMMVFGFAIAVLGFAYALFVLVAYFYYGTSVLGWTSIMMTVLLLGGFNAAMLGFIGGYLCRNLDETRKRPLYFIEDSSGEKGAK